MIDLHAQLTAEQLAWTIAVDERLLTLLQEAQENRQFGKTLSADALMRCLRLIPMPVKAHLTEPLLDYAIDQLLLDPEPRNDLAVSVQLMAYLFPLSNGQPNYQAGFRQDLQQRMAVNGLFHPLVSQPAQALAPTVEERPDHLLAAGMDIRLQTKPLLLAAKAAGDLGGGKGLIEAQQGETAALLAAGTLVGYWTLEQLDTPIQTRGLTRWAMNRPWRNLARDWIQSHPKGWAAMQSAAQERLQGASKPLDDGSNADQAEGAFSGLPGASEGQMGSLLGW